MTTRWQHGGLPPPRLGETLPSLALFGIGFAAVGTQRSAVASPEAAIALPTERQAFRFWLKLGMISFGGPAGQIAIMHDELVERRRWISERRFLHALNFCMALPVRRHNSSPPTSATRCTGFGERSQPGGSSSCPSFLLLCVMSAIYVEYGEVAAVAGVVRGLGAAVIALVAAAVLRVGGRVIHTLAALAWRRSPSGCWSRECRFP